MLAATTLLAQADPAVSVYPGAKLTPLPKNVMLPDKCGSKTTMQSFESSADAPVVAGWYKSHAPGFVATQAHQGNPQTDNESKYAFASNDGSTIITVHQVVYSAAQKKLASSNGMGGLSATDIGILRFHPALPSKYVSLMFDPTFMRDAASEKAADQSAAAAKVAAACGGR